MSTNAIINIMPVKIKIAASFCVFQIASFPFKTKDQFKTIDWFLWDLKIRVPFYFEKIFASHYGVDTLLQSKLYITATFGTIKAWSLYTGGCHTEKL